MFWRRTSLETRAMLAAVLSLSLFFACIIFGLFWANAQFDYRSALRAQSDLIRNFSNVISRALQTYDVAALTDAANVFSARPDIASIEITGRYNDVLVAVGAPNGGAGDEVGKYVIPVTVDGESVGQVVVDADNTHVAPAFWVSFRYAFLAFLLCGSFGAAVLFYYIRRFVSRPLRELQKACEATVRTGEHHAARLVSDDRFGEYANSFNKMQEMLSNVTRQKSALVDRMIEDEKTLETFLMTGHSAISVFGRDGRLLMRRGKLIGQVMQGIEAGEDDLLAKYRDFLAGNAKAINEGPDGAHYLVEASCDSDQRISRSYSFSFHRIGDELTALFAFDITDLRLAELEIAQLQKTKALGELTSGIAHDFNNILFTISASSEALLDAGDTPALTKRQRKLVEHCLDGSRMGADLTQQLLAYSRQNVLDEVPIQLEVAIPRICGFLRRGVGVRYPINLRVETHGWLFADLSMLQRALMNLVLNARDAMPDGGLIEIRVVETSPKRVEIRVFNIGPPIPEDIIGRVFDPFVTTRRGRGGSGLGLSVVEGFARQSGGSCEIRNTPNGVEVTLSFALMDQEGIEAAASAAESADIILPEGKRNILVIDDNEKVLETTRLLLEGMGHLVSTRLGADKLADDLQSLSAYDLVFVDVMMPGMDGVSLTRAMRDSGVVTPVILMTGLMDHKIEQQAAGIALCRAISKPVTSKTIRQMLATAI
ncbi:MAG: ATP-binding protein [Paracoccus sp. (in: a-proteobacteria)]